MRSEGSKLLGIAVARDGQAAIARRIGVSQPCISFYVSGQRVPSEATQARIELELGIARQSWPSKRARFHNHYITSQADAPSYALDVGEHTRTEIAIATTDLEEADKIARAEGRPRRHVLAELVREAVARRRAESGELQRRVLEED